MKRQHFLLILSVFFFAACGPEAAPRESTRATTVAAPQASPLIPADNTTQQRAMGNPAAPIVLVEYSDYQ